MDCFAPFSASGNARIRLSSRRGGGGREDYFAGNASSFCWIDGMLLPVEHRACFIRFERGRRVEGGGEGRVDNACAIR